MSVPIPLRGDFNAAQLHGLAKRTKDGPQARRLLALAVIYDGGTRSEAAKLGGVGLQIVHDWVLRLNAQGVFVLEVAARPIGGLCARALQFERAPTVRVKRNPAYHPSDAHLVTP